MTAMRINPNPTPSTTPNIVLSDELLADTAAGVITVIIVATPLPEAETANTLISYLNYRYHRVPQEILHHSYDVDGSIPLI